MTWTPDAEGRVRCRSDQRSARPTGSASFSLATASSRASRCLLVEAPLPGVFYAGMTTNFMNGAVTVQTDRVPLLRALSSDIPARWPNADPSPCEVWTQKARTPERSAAVVREGFGGSAIRLTNARSGLGGVD